MQTQRSLAFLAEPNPNFSTKSWLRRFDKVGIASALAMVLWYHPRLISKRSLARFQLGAQKLFSSLFRCYLTD
jgi:hypothetical protein